MLFHIILAALSFFTVNVVSAVCTVSRKHCHFFHFTAHPTWECDKSLWISSWILNLLFLNLKQWIVCFSCFITLDQNAAKTKCINYTNQIIITSFTARLERGLLYWQSFFSIIWFHFLWLISSLIPGTQKVWMKTWGCSHNNSDGEYMAGQLAASGYKITG